MARKLPVLQRVVGEDALFAAIYGTISSSLYFALGVVALYALGLTPIVLPVVGLLVALAAGAYAEARVGDRRRLAADRAARVRRRRRASSSAGRSCSTCSSSRCSRRSSCRATPRPRSGNIGQMSGRSAELIGVGVIAVLGLGQDPAAVLAHGSRAAARARRHARAAHARDPRPRPRWGTSTCSRARSTSARRRPGRRSATRSRSRSWPSRASRSWRGCCRRRPIPRGRCAASRSARSPPRCSPTP